MKVSRSEKVDQESWKNFSNYWFSIADGRRQSLDGQGRGGVREGIGFSARRSLADNNGIGLVQLRRRRRRIRRLNGAT